MRRSKMSFAVLGIDILTQCVFVLVIVVQLLARRDTQSAGDRALANVDVVESSSAVAPQLHRYSIRVIEDRGDPRGGYEVVERNGEKLVERKIVGLPAVALMADSDVAIVLYLTASPTTDVAAKEIALLKTVSLRRSSIMVTYK